MPEATKITEIETWAGDNNCSITQLPQEIVFVCPGNGIYIVEY